MTPRRAASVLFVFFATATLSGPTAAASSHPDWTPTAEDAVVDAFFAWWVEATCSYEAGADCPTTQAVRDAIGVAALGVSAASWPAEDRAVASWILDHPEEWDNVTSLGPGPSLAMTVLALEGARVDPAAVPADGTTRDLVAELAGHKGPDGYGTPIADAWALFAFNVAGVTNGPATDTAEALAEAQRADGGWSWAEGHDPDPDTTAWAVTALAPHVPHRPRVDDGLAYLQQGQIKEGERAACWPGVGDGASAASTSVVLGALVAAGNTQDAWRTGGQTPFECFLSFQRADGSFETAFAAYQTARALGGVPLGWPTSAGASDEAADGSSPAVPLGVAVATILAAALMRRRP